MGRRQSRQRVNSPPPSGPGRVESRLEFCRSLIEIFDHRPPAALAGPLGFHSAFCLHPLHSKIDRSSEVLSTRILDTSGLRSSIHYANHGLRVLRIPILDTSGPKPLIHYANYALRELGILNLDTSGPILLRTHLPNNRSTRLSSSGSIHSMMISRGRR